MVTIQQTNNILQYRNMYFAKICAIVMDGLVYGYKYQDGDKIWYTVFYDREDVELPEDCHFGEGFIYIHTMESVEYLCSIVPESVKTRLPKLSEKVAEFENELYF